MAPANKRKKQYPSHFVPGRPSQRSRRGAFQSSRRSSRRNSANNSAPDRRSTSSRQGPHVHQLSAQNVVNERNELQEAENLELVVMAVDIRDRGRVGCAYYVAREERLFCMEEVRAGDDSLIQTRK